MKMILLCLLFFALSTSFSDVIIESNYPLRNSNFLEFKKEEDLTLLLWALQNLKDVKDIKISVKGKDTVIFVERYPLVEKVEVKGNWFAGDDEIKNLIGVREGEPLIEFDPENASLNLKRFYRERGFLNAEVQIEIKEKEGGFLDVVVRINEGDLYFMGYPIFEGLKSVSWDRVRRDIGIIPGTVFNESAVRDAQEKASSFLSRLGFYENIVYYRGSKGKELKKPFPRVLFPSSKGGFRGILTSFLHGFTNLLTHPIATIKALTGKGKIAVPEYSVIEGRRFRISFEGNQYFEESRLRELIFKEGGGIDIFFLQRAKNAVEEAYGEKGFLDAKVSYSYSEGEIIFFIEEGERYKLRVKGNLKEDFPPYYDRKAVDEIIQEAVKKLKKKGYLTARVNLREEVNRQSKEVIVDVNLKKGRKVLIKDILYSGKDREIQEIFDKVRADLPAVLNEKILDSVERRLRSFFTREGYLEGSYSVEVSIEEKEEATELTYTYRVNKGPRYRYGKLIIYGNEKTKSKEIDYITVKQDFYSSVAEEETMWNLIQSEIFTGARIETFVDKEKKVVHRLLEVREDKRGSLELGVGYNTEEKLKVDAGLKFKNLFGLGIISRFYISASEKYRIYETGLSDNFFFTWKHFVDLSLFRRFEFHESFDLDVSGFSATLGYRPIRWYTLSAFYSQTENTVKGYGEGVFRLRRYGLFFVREKRDDVLNPRNMTHLSLRLTKAEGDRNYYKTEFNSFVLKELLTRFSFNLRIAGGQVQGNPPIFDRFFLGGLRDLRGYNFESVGYPLGGKTFVFGRLELMVGVYGPLWIALYGESGNVGEDFGDTLKSPKSDVGGAVGVDSPAGFIRLDFARALTPLDVPVPPVRIYLSIGYIY